jgi:membrane associated rhomboid family serine protease
MDLNPKWWFKLQRWKSSLQQALGKKEESYDPTHRMCPNCRALIERGASTCPFCGVHLRSPRARGSTSTPGRVMGVIPVPTTATAALCAVNVLIYAVMWYMTQNIASANMTSAPGLGGIDGSVLIRMGAKCPLIFAGQWWRLVTANFLHLGLLHIFFNMWCLVDIGPMVESLFGTPKFMVLYLVTGVCGFLLSLWYSPFVVSAGASAAILGLIGIMIGASFHHGTMGKDLRSQLWKWLIYIFIFGLFFAIDNAAHIGGLISGLALGYFVEEGEPLTQAAETLWNTLAVLSVLIIAGSFALMALNMTHPR